MAESIGPDETERPNEVGTNKTTVPSPPPRPWLLMVAMVVIVASGIGLLSPVPFKGRGIDAFSDLLHAPTFACITCLALSIGHHAGLRVLIKRVAIVVLVILFGAAMEVMQKFSGRNPAIHDLVANALGAFTGWWLIESWWTSSTWLRWSLRIAALCLFVLAESRPASVLLDVFSQHRDFPVLGSFESDRELRRWFCRDCEITRSFEFVTHGNTSARVALESGEYPAMMLFHLPCDWSAYAGLTFDLALDSDITRAPDDRPLEAEMVLKISDRTHDDSREGTYQLPIKLIAGSPQHIAIELSDVASGLPVGELDLRWVRIIELQAPALRQCIVVYIDNLRLTGRKNSLKTTKFYN